MRWPVALLITITTVLAIVPGTVSADSAPEPGAAPRGKVIGARVSEFPDWFKESFLDIPEDVAEAAAGGRHVILYFHTKGCPYCYKMIEENFKHSPYTGFLRESFDVIAIDLKGDKEIAFNDQLSLSEKELARHIEVRFTPTVLFLDDDNRTVLRLNGYRSVSAFEHALRFVHEKAYRHTTLSEYVESRRPEPVYRLRDHPDFVDSDDLSALANEPLLVLFEDSTCDECDALHDNILGLEQTREILAGFTVVRLDAHSEAPLVDVKGRRTTPKQYAIALGLTYRPGVVMFDRGREIMRIDGMRRTFHFQQALRYVAERHYESYPQYRDYARARQERLLGSGQDIDVWR